MLVVPDAEFDEFSPLAGFMPGLFGFEWALQAMARMPVDIWEPALPPVARVTRKTMGKGGYYWHPANASVLPMLPDFDRMMVLFTQDELIAGLVETWNAGRKHPALHVSTVAGGSAVSPSGFTRNRLKQFAEGRILADAKPEERAEYLKAVKGWRPIGSRRSTLRFNSHNVTVANEMALLTQGIEPSEGRILNANDDRDYVRAIRDSARAVRKQRAAGARNTPANRAYPLAADLVLFAPGMFEGRYQRIRPRADAPAGIQESYRMLQRQRGYAFQTSDPKEIAAVGAPSWVFLNSMRSRELRIQSGAVGMVCASTLAACIRLPAGIQRVRSVVGQLAAHLRAHPDAQPKTAKVFEVVQRALSNAIDPSLVDLVKGAETGVRIVADAPLEWLDLDGLPLGVRHICSRTDVTPGNLSLGQLAHPKPWLLNPDVFGEVLVLSSFSSDDPIRHVLRDVCTSVASQEKISFKHVEVQSREDLIAALNVYKGFAVVFDMHGVHEAGRSGELIVGSERVETWSLRQIARIPPVVILSACDTHAVDASHATLANGLISCGARAVLATFLPVRARDSAVFVAHLLVKARNARQRIASLGRSVSWAQIVTDLMREHLVADLFLDASSVVNAARPDRSAQLTLEAWRRIEAGESDWWEKTLEVLASETGWDAKQTKAASSRVIAASDTIRYVHVGQPETIIFSDQAIFDWLAGVRPKGAGQEKRPPQRRRRLRSSPD
jgi:hypothetical protein